MMNKLCGVYIIRNIVDNKWYVGSSLSIKKRWWNHKYKLNKGIHHNKYLQHAWDYYGGDSAVAVLIEKLHKDRKAMYDLLCGEYGVLDVIGNAIVDIQDLAHPSEGIKIDQEELIELGKKIRALIGGE